MSTRRFNSSWRWRYAWMMVVEKILKFRIAATPIITFVENGLDNEMLWTKHF